MEIFNKIIKLLLASLILILFSFIMTGCIILNINKIKADYVTIPISKKKLDIPKYGKEHPLDGYPYSYWNSCKQKQKHLNLISPETSEDSLIFRVWITNLGPRNGQKHELIEIKCDSNNWNGKLILMRVNFRYRVPSETITESKNFELSPKTNWKILIDSLIKLKIDVLPTDDSIPNYYNKNDYYNTLASTYSFEFATKKVYRFYQYYNINRAKDKFWQPKNIIAIINLLNTEFHCDSIAKEYFK